MFLGKQGFSFNVELQTLASHSGWHAMADPDPERVNEIYSRVCRTHVRIYLTDENNV
jgi:hypothetical protein